MDFAYTVACMVCVGVRRGKRMGSVSSRKHLFYIYQKRFYITFISKTIVAIFCSIDNTRLPFA